MTRQQQLELHPLHVTSVSAAVRWALEMPQSLHRGTEGARTKTRLPWMRVTHVFTEFQTKTTPPPPSTQPQQQHLPPPRPSLPTSRRSRTGSSGPDCRLQTGHVFRFGSLDDGPARHHHHCHHGCVSQGGSGAHGGCSPSQLRRTFSL